MLYERGLYKMRIDRINGLRLIRFCDGCHSDREIVRAVARLRKMGLRSVNPRPT